MTSRIGRWAYQPDSQSWKLDDFGYWLTQFSIYRREPGRRTRAWCDRCTFNCPLPRRPGQGYEGRNWGHRYDYRRWRLYNVPPQLFCTHRTGRKYPDDRHWLLDAGEIYRRSGREFVAPDVCEGRVSYRTGWTLRAPDYWSGRPHGPGHGRCTHQRLLREAMQVAERVLIREAGNAINDWARGIQQERRRILDSLAAIGGL
jgi:hypothetical protein